MTYEEAMTNARRGHAVKRREWRGRVTCEDGFLGQSLTLHWGDTVSPYNPSQADMNANDWVSLGIYDPPTGGATMY